MVVGECEFEERKVEEGREVGRLWGYFGCMAESLLGSRYRDSAFESR